jgi:hypothetical protein
MSEAKEAVTAFIIVKDDKGFYTAITDLATEINIEDVATLQDIKTACTEILDSINQQTIAASVVSQLIQLNRPAQSEEAVEEATVVTDEATETAE